MKKRTRLLIILLMALTMLFSVCIPGYAGAKDTIRVSVDGKLLEQEALERNGTVFLPLRAVCEALGYSVEWSKPDRSVTVKNEVKTILFDTKSSAIKDGGHNYFAYNGSIAPDYIGSGCTFTGGRIYTASEILKSCLGISQTFNQTDNALELAVVPHVGITAENKTIRSESDILITDIQYPSFTLKNQGAADKVNAVILEDIEKAKKQMQDNIKVYEGSETPHKYEIYFNYRIVYQREDLFSLVLSNYQFYGGAHGGEQQISHTFDVNTGAEYSLADLMKRDSGYRDYINKCVKADIMKSELADAQLATFESIADNQSYYISDAGLVIYFQEYEYFPYAAGIVEFTLPYANLSDYLKPELSL